jgi:predicted lipid-binding transport protein (Tim44 family)
MRYSRIISVVCAAFFAVALVVATAAEARIGGGSSSGSRGTRTFSAPAATTTAPSAAQPMQRSVTQPSQPGATAGSPATAGGGFFNRPGGMFGGGLLGGLAAGFIGAGLFGMLFGHGFMGGMGGFASILGLLLQIGLVIIVARLAFAWWQRRNQPAYAMPNQQQGRPTMREMFSNGSAGGGGASNGRGSPEPSDAIGINAQDYDAFEHLLTELQAAYSNEDIATLRRLATPEMVSYFSEDLSENASQGLLNKVSSVKLVQGDLSEAWREGNAEYATVAMRISMVDQMFDRATGRVVQGEDSPEEVVETWTFMRSRGGTWMLAAIQQS